MNTIETQNNNVSDNDFVGMTKQDAYKLCESRGLTPRVTIENGKSFIVTRDYRTDRVNFSIDNNLVVSCAIG